MVRVFPHSKRQKQTDIVWVTARDILDPSLIADFIYCFIIRIAPDIASPWQQRFPSQGYTVTYHFQFTSFFDKYIIPAFALFI